MADGAAMAAAAVVASAAGRNVLPARVVLASSLGGNRAAGRGADKERPCGAGADLPGTVAAAAVDVAVEVCATRADKARAAAAVAAGVAAARALRAAATEDALRDDRAAATVAAAVAAALGGSGGAWR